MAKKQIRSKCQKCRGTGFVTVKKMGVHSSNPKKAITVQSREPCKECDGRGFHVTFVEK